MDKSVFFELDALLNNIKITTKPHFEEYRKNYFLLLCKSLEISCNKNFPERTIFNTNQSAELKRIIAICIVRLMCYNTKIIWDWDPIEYRIKSFELIKEYAKDILKFCKVDNDDDNHIILEKLRDFESKIINKFELIKSKIINPKMAYDIRQDYMSTLSFYKNYIAYFVDEALISKERLNDLFETINSYNNSNYLNLLNNYSKFKESFELFLDDAAIYKNLLNTKIIIDLFERIYAQVVSDFGRSDLIKPANIYLSYFDRKYPLHLEDKKIQIKFVLQNRGAGRAFNVKIFTECDDILINNNEISLGTIDPKKNISIEIEGDILNPILNKTPTILVKSEWINYDETLGTAEVILELVPQRADIDWEKLKYMQPYSLEAVEIEDELVGRTEIIQKIFNKLSANKVESLIIHGQKRVGKTSIANIIKEKLKAKDNNIVVSLNVGDLNKTKPEKFVNELGNYIVDELINNPQIKFQLFKPCFDGAISPLLQIFRSINKAESEINIIIIIDEFDEIPSELYKFSDIGNTFFHNIRSLSKENFVGFVLVGSENIETIKQSTEMINKFENFRVDYFNKDNYWQDFQDLVRKPVLDNLEYEDNAIIALFNITEGNPFYTKLICGNVFAKAVENRNAYITEEDIRKGVASAIVSLEANEVNHFWKDSIVFVDSAKRDTIETQRRKFLVGYASIKQIKGYVTKSILNNDHKYKNFINTNELLENFKNRGIILEEQERLRIKPNFIDEWLIEKGINCITTGFLDEEFVMSSLEKEKSLYVKDEEMVRLSEKWNTYNGQKITSMEIKTWLNQFSESNERRLMFKILENMKFYGEQEVREKLTILHGKVLKDIKIIKLGRELSQREILLTTFSKIGKSGSVYLRKYAQENKIISDNIVNIDSINETLKKNKRIQLILIIDDIIGSGESHIKGITNKFTSEFLEIVKENNIKVIISSICGTDKGILSVRKFLSDYDIEHDIIVVDILNNQDLCFSDNSIFFDNESEKNEARNVAARYGIKLEKKHPLGFENSEIAVVFFDNCPNNTLPIIWKRGIKNPEWYPLFERKYIV